jgi:CBS-domain-containing membrane protein
MKAGNVMTRRVMSVGPDDSVVRAVRMMLQNHISGLPVVEPTGELVGIVTEGDFLRRTEIDTQHHGPRWIEFLLGPGRLATDYVRASGRKVSEVMTRDLKTISADTPLEEVVSLMERHHVKRLPVVENGKLIGIVSRANLLHALASIATDVPERPHDDQTIRERLLTELEGQPWAPRINVVVKDGIVELWGTITDERERAAFVVAAENVPGVKAVRDHLAWVEPMSGLVFLSDEDETKKAS